MTFDHEYIEKNNVIDNYLLGNLSEEDECSFEEHLLGCELCRNNVLQTEKVIDGLESFTNDFIDQKAILNRKKSKRLTILFMRVAAVLIIAVIISVLYIHTKNSAGNPDSIAQNNDKSVQAGQVSDTVSTEEINNPKKREKTRIDLEDKIALRQEKMAYDPSVVLENAIGDQMRGAGISVNAPSNSKVFMKNDTIIFDWSNPDKSSMWLVIKNNRGVTLYKENVHSPVREYINKPGLFYWQLLVNDNVIYTGKFIINE